MIVSLPRAVDENHWRHLTEALHARQTFVDYSTAKVPLSDALCGQSIYDILLQSCTADLQASFPVLSIEPQLYFPTLHKFIAACFGDTLQRLGGDILYEQSDTSVMVYDAESRHRRLISRQSNAERCFHMLKLFKWQTFTAPNMSSSATNDCTNPEKHPNLQTLIASLELEASYLCSSITRDIDRLMREMAIFKTKVSIEADRASLVHTKAGLSQSESVHRLTKLAFVFM